MQIQYSTTQRLESWGPHSLWVESLTELDKTIDQVFEVLQSQGKEDLLEKLCPYFGILWPSARALTTYLIQNKKELSSAPKILELGCGLAIPSLMAAKLGAYVTATDFHPEVPYFLEKNISLNQINKTFLNYFEHDWRNKLVDQKFDWVIGSDVLYEGYQPEELAKTFDQALKPKTSLNNPRAVLTDPGRSYLENFVQAMIKRGFHSQTQIIRAQDPPLTKEIFLIEFTRQ